MWSERLICTQIFKKSRETLSSKHRDRTHLSSVLVHCLVCLLSAPLTCTWEVTLIIQHKVEQHYGPSISHENNILDFNANAYCIFALSFLECHYTYVVLTHIEATFCSYSTPLSEASLRLTKRLLNNNKIRNPNQSLDSSWNTFPRDQASALSCRKCHSQKSLES